jgi:hypothetical protein
VAWGASLLALDDDHIGQCLGTTGIYDLAVSEGLSSARDPDCRATAGS